jgi:hypothetical protein
MLSVSPEFETAITAPARRLTGRVKINYSDALLDPSFTATGTDENRITQTEQAANGRDNMTFKWASLEGTTTLDGTFHPAPDNSQQANFNEFGYWNYTLSDTTTKDWLTNPELTTTFSERPVTSFFIAFDIKRNEYATAFDVLFYQGAVLAYTEVITGNTEVNRIVNVDRVDDCTSIVLEIKEWSEGDRLAKVSEFTPGLIQAYDESRTVTMTVLEEREISNDNSLPVGNISNNELTVEFQNIDGTFDANNTDSNVYGRVRPWVRCEPEIGVFTGTDYEYIPLGVFWAKSWSVPELASTANLSAQDRLSLLDSTRMTTGETYIDKTISELFEIVFNDAGLDVTEYSIDSLLDADPYTIPISWFDNQTHRQAVAQLAEAAACVVYTDRNGLIIVEPVDYLFSNRQFFDREYTRSEYMDKQNPNDYSDLANRITISTTRIQDNTGEDLFKSPDDEIIGSSQTDTITIELPSGKRPAKNQVATVDPPVSGVTVAGQTWYSWGGVVEVTNSNGTAQNYKLKVVGDFFSQVGGKKYITEDTNSIASFGQLDFSYKENPFLQSLDLAQKIGDSLLDSYKNPSSNVSVALDPGGDPSLELGDKIRVTDQYLTREFNITRQQIDFNGGLSMRVDGIISRIQRGQGDLAVANIGFCGSAITGKGE